MGAESVGRRHVTLQQVRADIACDELKRVFGGLAQCVALNVTSQEAKEEKVGFRVQQMASGRCGASRQWMRRRCGPSFLPSFVAIARGARIQMIVCCGTCV